MTLADAFIVFLITAFIIAYRVRDRSQDERKEQLFINSITGGPLE